MSGGGVDHGACVSEGAGAGVKVRPYLLPTHAPAPAPPLQLAWALATLAAEADTTDAEPSRALAALALARDTLLGLARRWPRALSLAGGASGLSPLHTPCMHRRPPTDLILALAQLHPEPLWRVRLRRAPVRSDRGVGAAAGRVGPVLCGLA